MNKLIFILSITLVIAQPEFSVITNNDPYPGKIFIHSMSEYMSILDTSLNYYWVINNRNKGRFNDVPLHEIVEIEGKASKLNNHISSFISLLWFSPKGKKSSFLFSNNRGLLLCYFI